LEASLTGTLPPEIPKPKLQTPRKHQAQITKLGHSDFVIPSAWSFVLRHSATSAVCAQALQIRLKRARSEPIVANF
jgi:hypothetical protein